MVINELLATKRSTQEKLLDPNVKNKVQLKKLYKSQKADLQKELRKLKETWWRNLSEEVQVAYAREDIKSFYNLLWQAFGSQSSSCVPLKSKDGNEVIKDLPGIINRWREHFADLFYNLSVVNMYIINNIPQTEIAQHMNDTPSIEEANLALYKLRSGKALGLDGIPVEILKTGRDHISSEIHSLITRIWNGSYVP
ncbi:uncharacterized protein LOC106879383 [Octopus bimaculoides]|uniref:uncharacterized protein LOC106879383 n=1 Tax=Octopus bimaculoides TaxID=37653 RepID=UPI00071CFD41|nr:uncharacterized protein LOC106879383 [Octopus bimaculoides]|eukprot:XP_014784397.1 PREDICTED: uncharacterized protein LOC106879383 [Octopus bimaculoides]